MKLLIIESCFHEFLFMVFLEVELSIDTYSRVHISSDEVFSKILKKPSIVQK